MILTYFFMLSPVKNHKAKTKRQMNLKNNLSNFLWTHFLTTLKHKFDSCVNFWELVALKRDTISAGLDKFTMRAFQWNVTYEHKQHTNVTINQTNDIAPIPISTKKKIKSNFRIVKLKQNTTPKTILHGDLSTCYAHS